MYIRIMARLIFKGFVFATEKKKTLCSHSRRLSVRSSLWPSGRRSWKYLLLTVTQVLF